MRPPRSHHRHAGVERAMLGDLQRGSDAPDQTLAIMRRLGYAQVTEREARRAVQRDRRRRVLTCLAGGMVIGLAAVVYSGSDSVRRPVDTTVPAAVRKDLMRQQQRLDRTIRTIRGLSPMSPAPRRPVAPPVRSEPLDRQLAVGPVRWI